MRTLAIETSGHEGGVALLDGDTLVAGAGLPRGAQAERLPSAIEEALEAAGWAVGRLELVVVSLGPGGFTGVRIGMAAAQGLAFGLEIPLVGVTHLELLAAWAHLVTEGEGRLYVALKDARRDEYYLGAWRPGPTGLAPVVPPSIVPAGAAAGAAVHDALAPHLDGEERGAVVLCGDGIPRAALELARWPEPCRTVNPPRPVDAAMLLGRLGQTAWRRDGAPPLLEPLYLRAPDARRPAPRPAPTGGPDGASGGAS